MLQLKTWSWNINLPNGKKALDIEIEVNKFLKTHKCYGESFEVFPMENGIMFGKVLYEVKAKKKK